MDIREKGVVFGVMVVSAVIVGVIVAFLSGCAIVGAPSGSADESIRKGEKTVVLLRVTAAVEDQPVNAVKYFGFKIASIDKGEPPQQLFFPASSSAETRQAGWMYLILRPGETYYLSSSFGVTKNSNLPYLLVPDMWFHVPHDRPFIYIGSLSVSCEGKINYFGVPYVGSCSRLLLADETESAKAVARDSFAPYGLPWTSLMWSWSALAGSQSEALMTPNSPLGVVVSTTKTVVTPKWRSRALSRTTGIGNWINEDTAKGLGNLGGGYPPGAAGAGLVMGYLLYLPVGTALGIAGGIYSEKTWQPCMERLAEELGTSDLPTEFDTTLTSALRRSGIDQMVQVPVETEMRDSTNQSGPKVILHAEIQRVTLSECSERWTFSVDAQIRARLWETSAEQYLYDRVFLNSERNRYPYHSHIPRSECRKIEEYCGEQGPDIVRGELTNAINSAVAEIAENLTQQPQ